MTKAELASAVSDDTGIEKHIVLAVIESSNKNIMKAVAGGSTVSMRGFGCYAPVKAAAKLARNISKNTSMSIPAHYRPKFLPYQAFKNKVRKLLSGNI